METKQKPLAEMSSQELTSYWNKRMERLLLGKKIVKVQSKTYLSGDMRKNWYLNEEKFTGISLRKEREKSENKI